MHIARGLYYGSYKSPRVLVWAIGVIILIVMMAKLWPNCDYDYINYTNPPVEISQIKNVIPIIDKMLPFNKARTKAIYRIGPHNKQVLDVIISGMLGDFWADKIPGNQIPSIRFNIEQSLSNTAYIHQLTLLFYKLGYCARPVPTLVPKSDKVIENRFNYRLSLFTFTNFVWIFDSFYKTVNGQNIKCVPFFIGEYLTPIGLSHWICQEGSYQKGQGIKIATNCFTFEECKFLATLLNKKYHLKTSVVRTGTPDQWVITIWKESLLPLRQIVNPYFSPEMKYKLGYF